MAVRIRVSGIRNVRGQLQKELSKRFSGAAKDTLSEIRKEEQVRVRTGKLRNGYRITRANSNGFDITNNVPYAEIVNERDPQVLDKALRQAERRINRRFSKRKNI